MAHWSVREGIAVLFRQNRNVCDIKIHTIPPQAIIAVTIITTPTGIVSTLKSGLLKVWDRIRTEYLYFYS